MKECSHCRYCFPDEINNCPTDGSKLKVSIPGDTVLDNRYQLDRRLGHGGMGIVFQGRHILLKTTFAIKVILPDLVGNDPMLVTRFRQEAMVAARMRHPNLVRVTDFGVVHGMPYLVMELIVGRSLHDILLDETRLPPQRTLEIMEAVCAGVGSAHKQGVIHRDLKPLNIMLMNGVPPIQGVKILDFGLAKIKSGELLGSFVAAQTTGLMGSPSYMAPELWSDDEPDVRTDVYSLGIILYQMLAGDVPYRGNTVPSIMKKHLTQPVPSFSQDGVIVPREIEAVVRKALAKAREDRYASVEELAEDFRQAVNAIGRDLDRTRHEFGSFDARTMPFPEATSEQTLAERQRRIEDEAEQLAREFEEAQRRADEARQRAEEAAKRKAEEEEARRRAEEEAARKRAQEEEARRRAEEARLKQEEEEEAERIAEEEAAHKRLAEIARQRAAEKAERKRAAEEAVRLAREIAEVQQRAEEARLRAEEEARRRSEEEAARHRAEEEARKLAIEVAETKQRAEEARQRAELEARRHAKLEAERQRIEEERARTQAEAEARKRDEEEQARQRAAMSEADRLSKEISEAQRRSDEAARLAREITEVQQRAEEAHLRAEEEARRRSEEEAARHRAEEEARKLALEVAETKQRAEEARQRAETEARRHAKLEAERRQVEEERARTQAEAEARKREEEEQARQRAMSEADRLSKEISAAQRRAEEAARRAEQEAERRAAEEAARRKAEEEARRLASEVEEAQRRVEDARKRVEEARRQAELEHQKHIDELAAATSLSQRAHPIADQEMSSPGMPTSPSLGATALGPSALASAADVAGGNVSAAGVVTAQSPHAIQQASLHTQSSFATLPEIKAHPAKKIAAAIGGLLVLLFLVGGLAIGLVIWRSTGSNKDTSKAPSGSNSNSAGTSKAPVRPQQIKIAGGTFQMGRSDIDVNHHNPDPTKAWYDLNQWPQHLVTVKDFSMDRTEVTNAEYADFVNQTKHAPPDNWHAGQPPAGQETWPVTYVSIDDVLAFAAWRSKRDGVHYELPSEEQWEYAARNGSQQTLYPWGNEWRENCANVRTSAPQAVATYPQCGSQAGILDLIGNVAEWTSTTAGPYPGADKLPVQLNYDPGQIIRGGSYHDPYTGDEAITATRRNTQKKTAKNADLGFRLVVKNQ